MATAMVRDSGWVMVMVKGLETETDWGMVRARDLGWDWATVKGSASVTAMVTGSGLAKQKATARG